MRSTGYQFIVGCILNCHFSLFLVFKQFSPRILPFTFLLLYLFYFIFFFVENNLYSMLKSKSLCVFAFFSFSLYNFQFEKIEENLYENPFFFLLENDFVYTFVQKIISTSLHSPNHINFQHIGLPIFYNVAFSGKLLS